MKLLMIQKIKKLKFMTIQQKQKELYMEQTFFKLINNFNSFNHKKYNNLMMNNYKQKPKQL